MSHMATTKSPRSLSPLPKPRKQQSKKTTTNIRPISIALNFGLSITAFLALIRVFDPSLDEHIHTIQTQNFQQPELSNHIPYTRQRQIDRIIKEEEENAFLQNSTSQEEYSVEKNTTQRDHVLELLDLAGLGNLTLEEINRLPKWNDIKRLYGDSIIIVGKERCDEYRQTVKRNDRVLGVAGMFNTGTNYLDITMSRNIHGLEQDSVWQVPWGKHRMAYVKWNHTAPEMDEYNKTNILPIIVIRDPYSWMQSMCKSPYAAVWRHKSHHCPNLAVSEIDTNKFSKRFNKSSFEVTVEFDENSSVHFDSLAHLWTQWYQLYLESDYPFLMIRYEDLIFQPHKVLEEIALCVEANVRKDLVFQVNSSKQHGSGTDYIKAITKTADFRARSKNMTYEDFEYASQHLNVDMMKLFHYKHPSDII